MTKARVFRASAIGALLLWALSGEWSASTGTQSTATFASHVAALSEPGGYFDTDNLISNERSYLEVIPELRKRGVHGGAYLGVGPDTNFSYIAAIRPDIAFIIDIRRDNLLLHLLFKALFALARTRAEYAALLFGRAAPASPDSWRSAPVERIVAHIDQSPLDAKAIPALRARVDEAIVRMGIPLTNGDRSTIDRFHRRFIEAGVDLRFQSIGRPPQLHYPMYRDLLLEKTPSGEAGSFLGSEEAFLFVQDLHRRDLVIPVVGDLSGPSAMAAIGKLLNARSQRVSAFYTSNVEFYLFNDGRFPTFVTNLGRLPRTTNSVVIRSFFQRYAWPGSVSASRLQSMGELVDGFAKGKFKHYGELMQ